MTQVHAPPRAYRPLASGAVGGLFAAAIALVVMVVAAVSQDVAPPVAPNAIGAWIVRWLQSAVPSALEGWYVDATVGGVLVFLLVGVLIGALFSGFLDRLPHDHPLVWGAVLGLALWALTRWAIAPATNPVLVRALPLGVVLVADLTFGLLLGAWVQTGRRVWDVG